MGRFFTIQRIEKYLGVFMAFAVLLTCGLMVTFFDTRGTLQQDPVGVSRISDALSWFFILVVPPWCAALLCLVRASKLFHLLLFAVSVGLVYVFEKQHMHKGSMLFPWMVYWCVCHFLTANVFRQKTSLPDTIEPVKSRGQEIPHSDLWPTFQVYKGIVWTTGRLAHAYMLISLFFIVYFFQVPSLPHYDDCVYCQAVLGGAIVFLAASGILVLLTRKYRPRVLEGVVAFLAAIFGLDLLVYLIEGEPKFLPILCGLAIFFFYGIAVIKLMAIISRKLGDWALLTSPRNLL